MLDLKCSCASLVYKSVILEIKEQSNAKVDHRVSQGIKTTNESENYYVNAIDTFIFIAQKLYTLDSKIFTAVCRHF